MGAIDSFDEQQLVVGQEQLLRGEEILLLAGEITRLSDRETVGEVEVRLELLVVRTDAREDAAGVVRVLVAGVHQQSRGGGVADVGAGVG